MNIGEAVEGRTATGGEREREGGELELGFDSRKEGTSSFPVLSQPSTDY